MPSAHLGMAPSGTSADRLGHELLARIVAGDPDALTEVYRGYASAVYRVAPLITLSPDDADDVVQDVFIGLPEALRMLCHCAACWYMT